MNFDALLDSLNFAVRQKFRTYEMFELIRKLITFKIPFKSITATFMAITELLFAVVLDTPVTPHGEDLNLDGYSLVFSDEFNGDAVDTEIWSFSEGKYRVGFNTPQNAEVKDGNLIITGDYKENGPNGAGWYGARLNMKKSFTRGYFEIRAILSENLVNTGDFWSAFWMNAPNCYNPSVSKGGQYGIELDIMENNIGTAPKLKNCPAISCAMWTNGVDDDDTDDVDGVNLGQYYVPNAYTEYHTYGFKWTETEYIWYIDGVESVRSTYGKAICEVPEYLILSLELPFNMRERQKDDSTQYIIDYLRVYQPAG